MKKSILLTGVLVLTLAFTACNKDKTDNTIHVESVSVASIHDLYVGDTFTVGTQTVTIEPSDASIQTYTLESDNTDVFTVDGYVITAVGLGEAKLTVITDDGGLTDWTTINVVEKASDENPNQGGNGNPEENPDPTDPEEPDEPDEPEVVSITFEPDTYTLYVGDDTGIDLKDHVHVEVKGEISEEYTLKISGDIEESVITLEDGWVKPKGEETGEAEVIATAVGDETKTATATITVDAREVDEPYISSIKFDENINYSVEVGKEPLDLSNAIIPTWENVDDPDTYEGEYNITFAVVSGGAEYIQIENETYVKGLQSTTGLDSLPQVVALVTGNESVRATQGITVTYPQAISGVTFKESSYTLEYEEETSFAENFEVNIVGTDGVTPDYTWELSCSDDNVTISGDKHSVTATGDVNDAVLTITVTCEGLIFSGTTSISCVKPDEGTVIKTGKIGLLYEESYHYLYFTGTVTNGYKGGASENFEDGVDVAITKYESGTYTLTFEQNGTTYYVGGYVGGNNDAYYELATYTAPCYIDYDESEDIIKSDGTYASNIWYLGAYGGEYFQWMKYSFLGDSGDYTAHIYTEAQTNPEPPVMTVTLTQVYSITSGETYYLGGLTSSVYHLIDGTMSSYNLATTSDFDSATGLTVEGDTTNGYKLTIQSGTNAGKYIYGYAQNGYVDFGVSSNSTVPNSGSNLFLWNSSKGVFYSSTVLKSSYSYSYFEFYSNVVQLYGTSNVGSASNTAALYQATYS